MPESTDLNGIGAPIELPTPNLPLLRKVLDHIDAHPEQWNQASFAKVTECGTALCVAGHAAAMSEGLTVHSDDGFDWIEPASGRSFEAVGIEALGLTPAEAEDMFYNTIDGDTVTVPSCADLTDRQRVQLVAEQIAARAGERL